MVGDREDKHFNLASPLCELWLLSAWMAVINEKDAVANLQVEIVRICLFAPFNPILPQRNKRRIYHTIAAEAAEALIGHILFYFVFPFH